MDAMRCIGRAESSHHSMNVSGKVQAIEEDDQKTLAVVRRFLGVEDGWEQLVSGGRPVGSFLVALPTNGFF